MKLTRSILRTASVVAALTLGSVAPAHAQPAAAFPNKPIKLVLPYGPGSGSDIVSRVIGEGMSPRLHQPVIVDYRPGGNAFIASGAVARAEPDGYTLLVAGGTTHTMNPNLFKKLPYDPDKDFEPVGGMIQVFYIAVLPTSSSLGTLQELIAWLKANPQAATYTWGATVSQIAGASFLSRIGATATGIPYKSSPQSITDLIGGQLGQFAFSFADVTTGLAHVKAGRIKALAVTSPTRVPSMPDVPTTAEAGLPGFLVSTYVGLFAPAGTPAPIVRTLNDALQSALNDPLVKNRLDTCCYTSVFPTSPSDFKRYVREDRAIWAERISTAGIKPE